jgi:hypothetical protein
MTTLVITSVNPYAKLVYQKSCFFKWKELGHSIKTFNCEEEKEILLKNGFNSSDIVKLSQGETSKELFGKSVPRILPVLKRASDYKSDYVILVNSDIYPALKKSISFFLSSLASNIALTRNECIDICEIKYTNSLPYRGGVDIFFFTIDSLRQIEKNLSLKPSTERMTFGMPGWDFFLAHEMICYFGGIIMDSEVFFHKTHSTSYKDSKEMKLYAIEMLKSGLYRSMESGALTTEFAEKIKTYCIKNTKYSKLLKLLYFAPPNKNNITSKQRMSETLIVESNFNKLLNDYNIRINYNQQKIKSIIYSQLNNLSWKEALLCYNNFLSKTPFLNGYLILVLLQLTIKEHIGNYQLSTTYPKNNLHNKAVQQITVNNLTEQEKLMYILNLFSSELIDDSIFNNNLFKYIIYSTDSPYSLELCSAIYSICHKRLTINV